ncbi:hypothetical protein P152DRAFT_299337 [Eremomyces bilateralis CBS 781.70]|uniref:N-acetyltransferase domain-containing protein n=1 Tax=Eremomyces bilateralis CBS 781.70 TaxID=1392243 RepID=A0A6G1G7D6_9PEZI|nr:uncharacterized protein P152DRAFT_299337 [Eremomyces bilateralis CBS 781.70]KAF1813968.1 hypothetical protein P152DRAFT_299337 [Eremomyces bilateralis CBS 781.70]
MNKGATPSDHQGDIRTFALPQVERFQSTLRREPTSAKSTKMAIISKGDGYIIRNPDNVEEVQALFWPFMNELGWNRSKLDGLTHYVTAGAASWFLLCPTDSPKPEGFICAFTSANATGWIGFFCINAPYRGRGWGTPLFQASLDLFKARGMEFVGLDAVEQQVGTYTRRGFVDVARVRTMIRPAFAEMPLEAPRGRTVVGERLVDVREIAKEALVGSDFKHTGMERRSLWTDDALFHRTDTTGFAIVGADGGRLRGWILSRTSITGHRIGPLYAESARLASVLVHAVLENLQRAEGDFAAEIPVDNIAAQSAFEHAGFAVGGPDMHCMWLDGKVPEEQKPGGKAATCAYAWFDAGQG